MIVLRPPEAGQEFYLYALLVIFDRQTCYVSFLMCQISIIFTLGVF